MKLSLVLDCSNIMDIKEHQAETATSSSNNGTLRRSGSAPSMFHLTNDKEGRDEQTDSSEQFNTTTSTNTNDASSYMTVDVPLGDGKDHTNSNNNKIDEEEKKPQEQSTEPY